jgi:hypothetical protein
VAYYGEQPGTLLPLSDLYVARRGTKFQNLHYCYLQWRELLAQYDAVMVMDDDILIDATGITRLFEIRRDFDLWALQPAFRVRGKISWDVTRIQPAARLRFTNFVEMTCPLFRRDKLDAFMEVYDPAILGYGEDWWFLRSLGPDLREHVAVVDEVPCINPNDRRKGGVREIDRISTGAEREAAWQQIKRRYSIDEHEYVPQEFGRIEKPLLGTIMASARFWPESAYLTWRGVARRLLR